jgi:hypothetical protein
MLRGGSVQSLFCFVLFCFVLFCFVKAEMAGMRKLWIRGSSSFYGILVGDNRQETYGLHRCKKRQLVPQQNPSFQSIFVVQYGSYWLLMVLDGAWWSSLAAACLSLSQKRCHPPPPWRMAGWLAWPAKLIARMIIHDSKTASAALHHLMFRVPCAMHPCMHVIWWWEGTCYSMECIRSNLYYTTAYPHPFHIRNTYQNESHWSSCWIAGSCLMCRCRYVYKSFSSRDDCISVSMVSVLYSFVYYIHAI